MGQNELKNNSFEINESENKDNLYENFNTTSIYHLIISMSGRNGKEYQELAYQIYKYNIKKLEKK